MIREWICSVVLFYDNPDSACVCVSVSVWFFVWSGTQRSGWTGRSARRHGWKGKTGRRSRSSRTMTDSAWSILNSKWNVSGWLTGRPRSRRRARPTGTFRRRGKKLAPPPHPPAISSLLFWYSDISDVLPDTSQGQRGPIGYPGEHGDKGDRVRNSPGVRLKSLKEPAWNEVEYLSLEKKNQSLAEVLWNRLHPIIIIYKKKNSLNRTNEQYCLFHYRKITLDPRHWSQILFHISILYSVSNHTLTLVLSCFLWFPSVFNLILFFGFVFF